MLPRPKKISKTVMEAMYAAVVKELGKNILTPSELRDWNHFFMMGVSSTLDRYFYNQLVRKMERRIGPKARPLFKMQGDFLLICHHLKKIKAQVALKRTIELRKQGRI